MKTGFTKFTAMNTPLIKHGWLRALIFLVIWILVQDGLMNILYNLLKPIITHSGQADPSLKLLLIAILGCIVNLPVVFLFRKLIDRKTFLSLGFQFKTYEKHGYSGLLTAIFIFGLGTLILLSTGILHFIDFSFSGQDMMLYILIMALVAISEETVVRGYLLNNLLESFPKWIALMISATAFSLIHLLNPGFTWISLLGIFTGGILLGLNYMYTGNLWFGIFLHFGWNFLQGPVLGYNVSGIETESLLIQSTNGPDWLTGGAFGFEGSLLSTLVILPAIAYFSFYYRRNEWALAGKTEPGGVK